MVRHLACSSKVVQKVATVVNVSVALIAAGASSVLIVMTKVTTLSNMIFNGDIQIEEDKVLLREQYKDQDVGHLWAVRR